MSKAANAYLATQVTTTSQGKLLVMLYDAGIKFLRQAKEYMIAKDYAKKGILISRAMDIITELASSLNKEKGGQIAENLQSLYTFCNIQLAKANMRMDTKKIDDVITVLSNIRDAYEQILPQVEGEKSTTAKIANRQRDAAAARSAAAVTPAPTHKSPLSDKTPAAESGPASAPKSSAPTAGPTATKQPDKKEAATKQAPSQAAPPRTSQQKADPKQPIDLARHRAANAYSNNM